MPLIMASTTAMATPVRIAPIAQFLAYFEAIRAPERCPTSQAKSTYKILLLLLLYSQSCSVV
jgi:hypothetical protein